MKERGCACWKQIRGSRGIGQETSWRSRKWARVRFDARFGLNLVFEMRDWWCCSGSMPDGWHFPFGDHIDGAKIWRALTDVRGYVWTFHSPRGRKCEIRTRMGDWKVSSLDSRIYQANAPLDDGAPTTSFSIVDSETKSMIAFATSVSFRMISLHFTCQGIL